jgi:hypothetical protein
VSADAIERSLNQVRLGSRRGPVHDLADSAFDRGFGWSYRSRCGELLLASAGAVLTTRRTTCGLCLQGQVWRV